VIARVEGGALGLAVQARRGDFYRVDLSNSRPGWVKASDVSGSASGGAGKLRDVLAHRPPTLTVDYGATLVTQKPALALRGTAEDDSAVRDLYIFVGSRKVFYHSNRAGQDPKRVSFDTSIPLQPGINFVTVVARENAEIASREVFIVRRDGIDGSLLATPKESELEPFHEMEGQED
jgi:carboxyl-terminal processing protease